jgi:CheY-like chemotaxis protein
VLGCRVVLARDGREGVERFQEYHHELVLVLLDMMMPNMNGRAAFDSMRAINARVPIVMCSGYAEDAAVRAMLAHGLTGFLAKPYRFVQLTELVNHCRSGAPQPGDELTQVP